MIGLKPPRRVPSLQGLVMPGLQILLGCICMIVCILSASGCVPFPTSGKHLLISGDPESNVSLILEHHGGGSRSVEMRLLIDEMEICSPQQVRQRSRPFIHEVAIRLAEGHHRLHVKIEDPLIEAEKGFEVTGVHQYLYIGFENHRHDRPSLTIRLSPYRPGFA